MRLKDRGPGTAPLPSFTTGTCFSSLPGYKSVQNCLQGPKPQGQGTTRNEVGLKPSTELPLPRGQSLEKGCPVPHVQQGGQAESRSWGVALPRDTQQSGSPEQTQPGLWSVLRMEKEPQACPAPRPPPDAASAEPSCRSPSGADAQAAALNGVTHAAPCACRLHTGLDAGPQEPIGDRVLRDDVLHPGDVQECQQYSQELRRRRGVGVTHCLAIRPLSSPPALTI